MAIINGKKRYIPDETPKPPVEKKRYEPPLPRPPLPVKRKGKGGGKDDTLSSKLAGCYEFEVRIKLLKVSFSKILNIENKIETEMFIEGGNNDFPIVRQKAKQQAETIIFEKGVTDNMGGTIFSVLRQGMIVTDIFIIVKKNNKLLKFYSIDQGLILSKKYSDLDANSSTIFIERLELAHTGIQEIFLP